MAELCELEDGGGSVGKGAMGKREKRPKRTRDESAEAEAWLAECTAAESAAVKPPPPPPPAWPDPVQHYGTLAAAALASPPTDHLARAFDAAQAVRLALAIGAGGAWLAFAESRLEAACQALREDEELAPDARAFAAYMHIHFDMHTLLILFEIQLK